MRFLGSLMTLGAAIGLAGACAGASGGSAGDPDGGGGAGSGGSGATGTGGSGGTGNSGSGGSGGSLAVDAAGDTIDPDAACGLFTAEARATPAAVMLVLDRSSSMATAGKWVAAQTALAQVIDQDAFDGLSLGLIAYPTIATPKPACLLSFSPTVMCGVTSLPQVQLGDTGTAKSNQPGSIRNAIYSWLVNNQPDGTLSDASPGYEAMQSGIRALRSYGLPAGGRRIMIFVTDGGFGCASVTTRPGYSDGSCPDWEHPDSVLTLLTAARLDTTPVETFIVGVPGSDSTGAPQGLYYTPPYHMRLALSAYAYAGSPTNVPADCDGTTFNQAGGDPAVPCHFDMTTGTFSAATLADTLGIIRGRALGCSYELPQGDGGAVDPGRVNVTVTTDAGATGLARRADASDPCTADGCWDYGPGGEVLLLGKACTDLQASDTQKVDIVVGCETIVK